MVILFFKVYNVNFFPEQDSAILLLLVKNSGIPVCSRLIIFNG